MAEKGTFITFEGIDGSGKSTQLKKLAHTLREQGCTVVETVEPGGTGIGRQIRRILLDPANAELQPTAELLLYFASRAQNVEQVIRPALARGAIVLCDRFTDSTLVYQGCGRGLPLQHIVSLDQVASGGLEPDLTFLIDIDVPTSMQRCSQRNQANASQANASQVNASTETRIDNESAPFHQRVRDGYRALAREHSQRIRVIDGAQAIDAVSQAIWEVAEARVR